jgi:hypothetical protein
MIEVLVVIAVLKSGLVLTMASHAPNPKACEDIRPFVEIQERQRTDVETVKSICLEFQK